MTKFWRVFFALPSKETVKRLRAWHFQPWQSVSLTSVRGHVYHVPVSTPIAYLRKSRVIDERIGVSWEVQEGKVRELAAQHGDNGGRLLILSDWNISGRKGAGARPGYKQLLEMIAGGEVSAVYSYNLARLSRSVQDLRALMKLADEHGVPVRLVADQVDTSTATGRMLLTMLAAVDEMTADLASEHARDAVAARRARGDRIGHPFYGEKSGEDPEAVVSAFREAGSVMGACRILNRDGVPTRMGGPWATVSVREILVRLGAMPHRTRPGAKDRAPFMFYGLLRCHCGHLLTGTRYTNGKQRLYTAYKCHHGRTTPDHGLASVPEKKVLAWAMDEAARLRLPGDQAQERIADASKRDALAAQREKVLDMYTLPGVTREQVVARLETIDAELSALDERNVIVDIPALDWSQAPEIVNAILRAMWSEVRLGPDLQPLPDGFAWRREEWRA